MPSDFQEESQEREAMKIPNKTVYFYLKNDNESWDVKKVNSDDDKKYKITAFGSCDCKGFKYNESCKHSKTVMEKDFWPRASERKIAKSSAEFIKSLLDTEVEIVGFKEAEEGMANKCIINVDNEDWKENYKEVLIRIEDVNMLIKVKI